MGSKWIGKSEVIGGRRGSKTLEQVLIEEALTEAAKADQAVFNARNVLENSRPAPAVTYLSNQVDVFGHYLGGTVKVFNLFDQLMSDTSVVGHLSKNEKRRRALALIKSLGEAEILDLLKQASGEQPSNIIYLTPYKIRKDKSAFIQALTSDEPKDAA